MTWGGSFDPKSLNLKVSSIEKKLQDPEVWKDHEKLNSLNKEKTIIETKINEFLSIEKEFENISDLINISIELSDNAELSNQIVDLDKLIQQIDSLETKRYFSKKDDSNNAFLDIQSGSGGTEAQDWAEMLLRMYSRWSEENGFKTKIEEYSPGDVAGIKSASLHIKGDYAYGWLRTESGIHRLVRKSPFDSGSRRHTSFAAVFVSPEVDDDIEINLEMSDVRIDTYRASGAGGQHVNKTESAIRITHIPTNLIVTCQDESSQHKNRDKAMKVLRARLFDLETEKLNKKRSDTRKEMVSTGDRSAKIRTYNYPQGRVTDHRINLTLYKLDEVMDGNIICLIEPLQLEDQKNKLEHIAE